MKKYFYFAAALLTLASCADDGYVGDKPTEGSGVISFNLQTPTVTRGTSDDATKLNKQFIIWGEKNETSDGKAATNANMVLKNYVVNYVENTANTTESNSANWEYVGQQNSSYTSYVTPNIGSTPQTIKYWDFGATGGYVFTAVSAKPADIASGKVTIAKVTEKTDGNKVYDKGYTVTVKSGASVDDIYYSDRKVVTPNATSTCVQMTFRNFMSKIRFGIYETIPGYKVSIDKVYYNNTNSTSNFGVDGSFLTAGTNDMTFNVTYYKEPTAQENKVKVALSGSSTNTVSYKEIASSQILSATELGTSSDQATKDDYVTTMPYTTNTTNMKLKVDYTLTSEDTGETIKVTGATAEVPSIYCQWQSNFAYTYLFKISDNTNGSTGSSTTGLYPLTFDAVVETDASTGTQETITSVTDPSITTYAKGVVVTANNEYTAGTIYFTNATKNVENYKVYEVKNFGTEATTEKVVANWQNNFVTLTEVTATDCGTDGIPLSDGTKIATVAKQAKYFTAAAGKVYAIASNSATATGVTYKVVKVTGTETAATYTLTKTTDEITAATGTATYALTSSSPTAGSKVLGADKVIKIYDAASDGNDVTSKFAISKNATDGSYDIALTSAAIAAGANGTYYVAFDNADRVALTVNLTYTLTPATVSVAQGATSGAITAQADGTLANGTVVNNNTGITVDNTATGTYKVTVASTVAASDYTLTIGGATLTVTVTATAAKRK